MNYLQTTLHVSDIDHSKVFYRDIVGLPIQSEMKTPDGTTIVFLGEGETKIELIQNTNQNGADYGTDISIGFEVKSVDDMISLLEKKGIQIHSGPIQPSPMVRFFFVQDPDGLKVQFVEYLQQKK